MVYSIKFEGGMIIVEKEKSIYQMMCTYANCSMEPEERNPYLKYNIINLNSNGKVDDEG